MTLAGKVAFVTGASRGIGRASAIALSQEGLQIAVGFREDKDGALETASACGNAKVVRIDVTEPESIDDAVVEIEGDLGRIEILVNNAGVTRDRLLIRMTEQDWGDVIETDLSGVFRLTKKVLPGMLKEGWGRIVTIGSVVGLAGNPGQTNYAAAKAGVVGFSKALAREVASHGITVNVVAPGLVDTDLTSGLSAKARQALIDRIPLERAATPEEVAEAVRFCVRASYLTGQVISIDGGLS